MANQIQIPPPPAAPAPHPLATHGAHVSVLAEKLAASLGGKSVVNAKMLADAVSAPPANLEIAAPAAEVEAAPVEEAPVEEAPADDTPAPAVAKPQESSSSKLARSLEIQKRAEATA